MDHNIYEVAARVFDHVISSVTLIVTRFLGFLHCFLDWFFTKQRSQNVWHGMFSFQTIVAFQRRWLVGRRAPFNFLPRSLPELRGV